MRTFILTARADQELKDKKLKAYVKRNESMMSRAALDAARAEILLPEQAGMLEAEGMEKTYKFSQQDIVKHVDVQSAKKVLTASISYYIPNHIPN